MSKPQAVIIGVGDGLSAAIARDLARDHALTLAARSGTKMQGVAEETSAQTALLDAMDEAAVADIRAAITEQQRVDVDTRY